MNFIKKLFKFLIGKIYRQYIIILLKKSLDGEIVICNDKLGNVKYNIYSINNIDKKMYNSFINEWSEYFYNGSECLLATVDKEIVGYSWIHYKEYKMAAIEEPLKLKNTEVYTGPAFVKKYFRGNGIHSTMMMLRCRYLQDNGYKYILSTVQPSNIYSIKTLKKNNFIPEGRVYKTWLLFERRFYRELDQIEAKKYINKYKSI